MNRDKKIMQNDIILGVECMLKERNLNFMHDYNIIVLKISRKIFWILVIY
jgi:hypothetical protein